MLELSAATHARVRDRARSSQRDPIVSRGLDELVARKPAFVVDLGDRPPGAALAARPTSDFEHVAAVTRPGRTAVIACHTPWRSICLSRSSGEATTSVIRVSDPHWGNKTTCHRPLVVTSEDVRSLEDATEI